MRRDEIRGLHEQRAHIHADMIKMSTAAEQEGRDLTAEEYEQFNRMADDMEKLEVRAKRGEKLYAQDTELQKTMSTALEIRAGIDDEAPATLQEWRSQRHGPRFVDSAEFRSAWFKYMGSRSIADVDVEEHRVLSRASNAAGGFTVPTDFEARLIEARRFLGSFETLSNVIVTDSGEPMLIPTTASFGSAAWLGENGAFTPSDDAFGQVTLNAFKAASKVIVSEELLQDSAFDLESYLARQFGIRYRLLEETAYINGDGTGKPQGILPNITSITAAAGAGNVTTFNYTALVTLLFTVPAQYRQNASFVVSDTAARGLYLMLDSSNRPIWNVDVRSGGGNMLLGYPVYVHPDMPATGAGNKSVMFGDWEIAYTIRRVRGIGIQRQNELHSDNGQIGFRGWERVDGRVVLSDAARAMAHAAT